MNIKKPFKSFRGDGKFAYVCYSLEDSEAVFPLLTKLVNSRYRIRYDECNQEDAKVDAYRKHNIKNCEVLLAFLSQKALQSPYVMNQLEMVQTFESNLYVVYLDGQETVDQVNRMFGTEVKGIRISESDEETILDVMSQLLKDCQEPERIEERVLTYDELLDEVYPDQENSNKESFVNTTDHDNDHIKKAAASAVKASKTAKTQKLQKHGRSFINAVLVVGAMLAIAFLIYVFFGDQLNEILHPDEVVNFIPAPAAFSKLFGMLL